MDFVKSKIESDRKIYIGIVFSAIVCDLIMLGSWGTFIMYGSLFLTSIFETSSWIDIFNIFFYAFGPIGFIIMFLPNIILLIFHYKWLNLTLYSGLPTNKRKLTDALQYEKFNVANIGINKKQIFESKNYVFLNNKLLRKGEDYQVKIGAKLKPDALVIIFQGKKIIIQTGLDGKALVDSAKKLKALLSNTKEIENVIDTSDNEEEQNKYLTKEINIRYTYIPFIISCVNSLLFLLLRNFSNLPVDNTLYIFLSIGFMVLGILCLIIFNIFGKKFLKKRIKFRIGTNLLFLLPFIVLLGLQMAVEFITGIY